MGIKLHKQATTTPKTRADIQAVPSGISDSALARQFGVTMTISMTDPTRVTTCWPPSRPSGRRC